MKILHLNYSDVNGGAARAAYRIHRSLLASGVTSRMAVEVASTDDWTVHSRQGALGKTLAQLRRRTAGIGRYLMRSENPSLHSPAVLSSDWPKYVNASDADIVHLHWIQAEMLSIGDLPRIKKPIVWTLHDMWAFCGAEHYSDSSRWVEGYRSDNRPPHEHGFDLNRFTWSRKKKHWRRPLQIVTSSRWLGDCARESDLMRHWPVDVIPYPIDITKWKPIEQRTARELLGLPLSGKLVLFGAVGGGSDSRKGFDLLIKGITAVRKMRDDFHLVVFGQLEPENSPDFGFPVRYAGRLYDDISLCMLYSAADVMIVPSKQEAFGQTALEAHACGTPVVSFRVGGLTDIVHHRETGYLAEPFSSSDLATGINWVLANSDMQSIRMNCVNCARQLSKPSVVASAYLEIYDRVLTRHKAAT